MKKGLSSSALKEIALLCMTADHAALLFAAPGTAVYVLLRFIGRLAMPVFCFQVAEGCANTRSMGRYAARLGLLALFSQLPFSWMRSGGTGLTFLPFSSAFTLCCGVLAVWALQRTENRPGGVLTAFVCVLAASCGDWGAAGTLWVVCFWLVREDPRKRSMACLFPAAAYLTSVLLTEWQAIPAGFLLSSLGLFCAPFLLRLYDGRRGGGLPGWAFYVFYPAHMAALTGLYVLLNR